MKLLPGKESYTTFLSGRGYFLQMLLPGQHCRTKRAVDWFVWPWEVRGLICRFFALLRFGLLIEGVKRCSDLFCGRIIPTVNMTEGETATVANGTGDCGGEGGDANLNNSAASEHDPHFEPIITLPEVVIPTLEEDEEEMIKLRAKLFRFDHSTTPSEWKDRGIGEVKLLKHRTKNTVRVVMRRDKTLKICANHFVTPWMTLAPNCGSDRAWVWSSKADYADETPTPELLAIRFANAENAQRWKDKFDEARELVKKYASEKDFTDAENVEDSGESEEEEEDDDDEANTSANQESEPRAEIKETESTTEVTEQLEKLNVVEKEEVEKPVAEPVKE